MKKRVTIYLDERQHRSAKILVAERGTNLSDFIAGLLDEQLPKSGKKTKARKTSDTAENPPIY